MQQVKAYNYSITLIFFWLESAELAQVRVLERVRKGGHSIPAITIQRRYQRGITNFFNIYQDKVDAWLVYDNSRNTPTLVAHKKRGNELMVNNRDIWNTILKHDDQHGIPENG